MSPCDINFHILVEDTSISILGLPVYAAWIIIGVCLLLTAIFNASETAFSASNKYLFKVRAEEGHFVDKVIYHFTNKFENTLITILISNNVMNTISAFISAMVFFFICQQYGLPDGVDAILSTVLMGVIIYVFGDTIPKIIAKHFPNRLCYILVYPVSIFYILFFPISLIFKGILFIVHKIFKLDEKNLFTKDDFLVQVDEAVVEEDVKEKEEDQEELFEPNEVRIMKKAFRFDTILVNDVLTKRENMYALSVDELNYQRINEVISEVSYSRIPIYEDTLDNIIGILVVKNYFKEYMFDPHVDIRGTLIDPIFINKEEKVDDIFNDLNAEKTHIAIVKENDKVIGLVTMEDILEELVGSIDEDKDNSEEEING